MIRLATRADHAISSQDSSSDGGSRRKLVGRAEPWQLVRVLAETEFSRIYAARAVDSDESLPVTYAVKMLRKEWWRDSAAIELFRRAVQLAIEHRQDRALGLLPRRCTRLDGKLHPRSPSSPRTVHALRLASVAATR